MLGAIKNGLGSPGAGHTNGDLSMCMEQERRQQGGGVRGTGGGFVGSIYLGRGSCGLDGRGWRRCRRSCRLPRSGRHLNGMRTYVNTARTDGVSGVTQHQSCHKLSVRDGAETVEECRTTQQIGTHGGGGGGYMQPEDGMAYIF